MNPDSKEDLWLVDHLDKCRCCFEKFELTEKQVKITEFIKEQFLELTQIEVTEINNKSTYLLTLNYILSALSITKFFKHRLYEMHK